MNRAYGTVPRTLPTTRADWEFQRRNAWNFDPNKRALPEDYPVNCDESDVTPFMFNAVGGSTVIWTAHAPRMHPSDFRVKSLDGVADDWPLTYDELEPYYDLNDEMVGLLRQSPATRPTRLATQGRCHRCRWASMENAWRGHSTGLVGTGGLRTVT